MTELAAGHVESFMLSLGYMFTTGSRGKSDKDFDRITTNKMQCEFGRQAKKSSKVPLEHQRNRGSKKVYNPTRYTLILISRIDFVSCNVRINSGKEQSHATICNMCLEHNHPPVIDLTAVI